MKHPFKPVHRTGAPAPGVATHFAGAGRLSIGPVRRMRIQPSGKSNIILPLLPVSATISAPPTVKPFCAAPACHKPPVLILPSPPPLQPQPVNPPYLIIQGWSSSPHTARYPVRCSRPCPHAFARPSPLIVVFVKIGRPSPCNLLTGMASIRRLHVNFPEPTGNNRNHYSVERCYFCYCGGVFIK